MTLASTTHRTTVAWIDTDAAGIYHNSAVVRYVEEAEARLMRERQLDDYFPVAPRVRYEVSFESPLFFGQEVTTHLAVTAIGTTSMTFGFEVWGEPHGGRDRSRAAHGSFVTVHLDRGHSSGATSSPWPAEWRRALTAAPDGPAAP